MGRELKSKRNPELEKTERPKLTVIVAVVVVEAYYIYIYICVLLLSTMDRAPLVLLRKINILPKVLISPRQNDYNQIRSFVVVDFD